MYFIVFFHPNHVSFLQFSCFFSFKAFVSLQTICPFSIFVFICLQSIHANYTSILQTIRLLRDSFVYCKIYLSIAILMILLLLQQLLFICSSLCDGVLDSGAKAILRTCSQQLQNFTYAHYCQQFQRKCGFMELNLLFFVLAF